MWKEFKAFLIKDNVIGLAIAVILGATLNKLVGSIVDDLIMPILSLVTPSGDWQSFGITLRESTKTILKIGSFLGALLNFFLIGFVLWRLSKIFVKAAESK
jgi:large conductance mechanosensitive channel